MGEPTVAARYGIRSAGGRPRTRARPSVHAAAAIALPLPSLPPPDHTSSQSLDFFPPCKEAPQVKQGERGGEGQGGHTHSSDHQQACNLNISTYYLCLLNFCGLIAKLQEAPMSL